MTTVASNLSQYRLHGKAGAPYAHLSDDQLEEVINDWRTPGRPASPELIRAIAEAFVRGLRARRVA